MRSVVAAFTFLLALSTWPPDSSTARVQVRSPDGRLRVVVTMTSSPSAPPGAREAKLTRAI